MFVGLIKPSLHVYHYLFFYLIIIIIQDTKNVKLEKIAESLPLPIKFSSRRKKLQRFLSLPVFQLKTLWFPIIREWTKQTFTLWSKNIFGYG